jgi:ribosomal protein S18 acetylase RimI-like enzyme
MRVAQDSLVKLGCPKVNLQVRSINIGVIAFFRAVGYEVKERVGMATRLASYIEK